MSVLIFIIIDSVRDLTKINGDDRMTELVESIKLNGVLSRIGSVELAKYQRSVSYRTAGRSCV